MGYVGVSTFGVFLKFNQKLVGYSHGTHAALLRKIYLSRLVVTVVDRTHRRRMLMVSLQ